MWRRGAEHSLNFPSSEQSLGEVAWPCPPRQGTWKAAPTFCQLAPVLCTLEFPGAVGRGRMLVVCLGFKVFICTYE